MENGEFPFIYFRKEHGISGETYRMSLTTKYHKVVRIKLGTSSRCSDRHAEASLGSLALIGNHLRNVCYFVGPLPYQNSALRWRYLFLGFHYESYICRQSSQDIAQVIVYEILCELWKRKERAYLHWVSKSSARVRTHILFQYSRRNCLSHGICLSEILSRSRKWKCDAQEIGRRQTVKASSLCL